MRRLGLLFFCGVGGLALAACSSTPKINVRTTWGNEIAQYGIVALYPPRENVYVGDVYLLVHNPCEDAAPTKLLQTALLGSIPETDIEQAFDIFYGNRPELPSSSAEAAQSKKNVQQGTASQDIPASESAPQIKPTSAQSTPNAANIGQTVTVSLPGGLSMKIASDKSGQSAPSSDSGETKKAATDTPSSAVIAQPVATDADPIFWPQGNKDKPRRPLTRLRLAAFPTMQLGSVVKGEVGGGGAFGGIARLSGAAGISNSTQIDVSVTGVEVSEIPAPAFYHTVKTFLGQPSALEIIDPETIELMTGRMEAQMVTEASCKKPVEHDPEIIFVTRVFYARGFDFSFDKTSAAATLLRAELAVPTAPATQNSTATGSGGSAGPVATNGAQSAADSISSSLSTLSGGTTPGVGATLAVGSDGGIALKQTFDRPLAFGIDASIAFHYSDLLKRIIQERQAKTVVDPQSPRTQSSLKTNDHYSDEGLLWFASDVNTTAPDQPSAPDASNCKSSAYEQACEAACSKDRHSAECELYLQQATFAKKKKGPCGLAIVCPNETTRAPEPVEVDK